ncbi:hypothetical protein K1T71_007502 [Dendrolimus kikuchii]|uniref:Uncharacterized protein n=1 Tax=Dendrolimus kikuchii TaxID=765133 RepID=A0ACC1D1P3_9NEOP|nr:hypothetical protein K1T71_007502 [Dendrolimus kikuchii]
MIATVYATPGSGTDMRPRVIAGQDADLKEYPYIVLLIFEHLLDNGTYALNKGCSGSLITERWVLTAGHCGAKWIRYGDTSVPFEDENMLIKLGIGHGGACARCISVVSRKPTCFVKPSHGNDIRPRVIGGQDADLKEYPYVVMIVLNYSLHNGTRVMSKGCSGSLINEWWVLTAGHCGGKWIRYGDTSVPFEDENMLIKVIKEVPFQNYISRTNDIKFLKLLKKATVEFYGKISVVDYKTLIGKRAMAVGFGLTYLVNHIHKYTSDRVFANRSMPLQRGDLVISTCKNIIYPNYRGPSICVSPTCGNRNVQVYFADSGSPLLVDGMIVGVGSYIGPHYTNAYAAVSPFASWIHSVVTGN